MRRFMITSGLVVLLLAAGCSADPSPAGAPAATPGPGAPATSPAQAASTAPDTRDDVTVVKEAFARSFAARTFTMDTRIEVADTVQGSIAVRADLDAGTMKVTVLTSGGYSELLRFGDEVLFKRTDVPGPDAWLRLDLDRLGPTHRLRDSFDVTRHSGILGGVVRVEKVEDRGDRRTYEGAADLNKAIAAAPSDARDLMRESVKEATNDGAVPFRAVVDAEGRLTSLVYVLDTKAGKVATIIRMALIGEGFLLPRPKPEQITDATAEQYAKL